VLVLGKWLVTLQGLSSTGRSWDQDVARKLLEDDSIGSIDALQGLSSDFHWQVVLENIGGIYRLEGQWQGSMMRHCSRCNTPFDCKVSGSTQRDYQLGKQMESMSDGDESEAECEYLLPPGSINLLDVLREDIWLAWQADVVCSETCKGLCSYCGCNRNKVTCEC